MTAIFPVSPMPIHQMIGILPPPAKMVIYFLAGNCNTIL